MAKFNNDSSQIVTASADQTARIWNAVSGEEIRIFEGHTNLVLSAAFN